MARIASPREHWLNRHGNGITAVLTAIGLVVTIIGFIFTVYQLRETQKALKASNTYTIQADSREIIAALSGDQDFLNYIRGSPTPATYTSAQAERTIATVFHFYLSVFRQLKADSISRPLATSMKSDFSRFFKNPVVKAFYEKRIKDGIYDDEIKEMVRTWAG